jgi:hypothetical protein
MLECATIETDSSNKIDGYYNLWQFSLFKGNKEFFCSLLCQLTVQVPYVREQRIKSEVKTGKQYNQQIVWKPLSG